MESFETAESGQVTADRIKALRDKIDADLATIKRWERFLVIKSVAGFAFGIFMLFASGMFIGALIEWTNPPAPVRYWLAAGAVAYVLAKLLSASIKRTVAKIEAKVGEAIK